MSHIGESHVKMFFLVLFDSEGHFLSLIDSFIMFGSRCWIYEHSW